MKFNTKNFSVNEEILISKVSEQSHTFKTEISANIVNGFQRLTIFTKSSILNIPPDSECISVSIGLTKFIIVSLVSLDRELDKKLVDIIFSRNPGTT